MTEEISLEEYKKAYREITTEEERRGFLAHLVVYVIINAMLIALNLLYVPQHIWFYWPLLGWGIGLTMHYLFGIRFLEKDLEDKEAKAEYRARESKK
jgi:hypothetical protein